MRFVGKVAIVTGAARGIGFALAKRLCSEGAALVIADIDEDAGINAAQRLSALGGRAIAAACDVADDRSMEDAVTKAISEFGRLDILVANAGLHLSGYTKPPCTLSNENWRQMLDVNVIGIVNGARACRTAMKHVGGGVIVTISSMAGFKGENAYGISKLAVRGLTVALAKELAGDGIRVCGVAPGLIGTEEVIARFSQERQESYVNDLQLIPRLGETDDVTGAVAFLASDEASFITAETILVSGGAFCRI